MQSYHMHVCVVVGAVLLHLLLFDLLSWNLANREKFEQPSITNLLPHKKN